MNFLKKIISIMKSNRFLTIFIIILTLSLLRYSFMMDTESENNLNYNEFIEKVEAGEVHEVVLNLNNSSFVFYEEEKGNLLKEREVYIVPNPRKEGFKEFLLINEIKVTEESSNLRWLSTLPSILIMLYIAYMFSKHMGLGSKVGTEFSNDNKKITFNDIAGNQEAEEEIMELVNYLKNPKPYKKRNAKMPTGAMLIGSPGTGKTLTAKAVAGEAGVPFYSISGSDFVEMFVGMGAKKVRKLYEKARQNAPCVVFIDEIDAIAKKRGSGNSGGHDEREQTLNQLLVELDGIAGDEGILTLVATNRPEVLDKAFTRDGRFDKHITIDLPVLEARKEIFELYLKDKNVADEVDVNKWAKDTVGQSGAFIASFVNAGVLESIRAGREKLTNTDLEEAYFKKIMKGSKRKNKNHRTDKENKQIAYHEAGHAIVNTLLTETEVRKVTILGSTSGAEGVAILNPKDTTLKSKRELEGEIKSLMGGRVAEEILTESFDEVSTGAHNDIEVATKALKQLIGEYSFSDKNKFINLRVLNSNSNSQESIITDEKLKKEVVELSNEFYKETMDFLKQRKELLEAVAQALIDNEVISGEELKVIISKYE